MVITGFIDERLLKWMEDQSMSWG